MDLSITTHPVTLSFIIAIPLFGIIARFLGVSFKRIAKWYLYLAVFAVVIVMNSIFFPFIGGKDYFFRFATELALVAFLLWWAFEARAGELKDAIRAAYKKPVVVAVSVFVGAVLLACIFAYDVHAAFWSNYERGEGGFQMLHYYVFFMLLTLLFTHEDDWKRIFQFSLVSAGLMILYGICGNLGWNGFIGAFAGSTLPAGFVDKFTAARFEGSLGNPAYVAPYLIFSMFYAAYLWVKRKGDKAKSALVHAGYGIMIAVFLLFFILSQTRGAFVGLGAGIFVMFLYFVFAAKKGPLRTWSAVALAVLIIFGGTLFALRNSPAIEKLNVGPGRLLQINLSDASAQTRLWVWGEAWQGFLERPIFGWGPENFTAVFDKFFNPNFFVPGQNTETWFDRAHSVFFDYLAETGVLGFLSYLGIFAIFAWEFFKKKIRVMHEDTADVVEKGLVLALPVAYLVQGIAIFDVLPMYINLFLFTAFAAWYFAKHEQRHG